MSASDPSEPGGPPRSTRPDEAGEFRWVPPAPPPPDPSIPRSTWWIVGAGVAVLGAAFLLLRGGSNADPATPTVNASTADAAPPATEPERPSAALTPPDPLDLTRVGLDARERARAWNPEAALTGLRLVVDRGEPASALEFEYGVPRGPLVPGAPLRSERLSVTVLPPGAPTQKTSSRATGKVLAEPNCPFDSAFRTLLQSGVSKEQRIQAEYLYSERHARPIYSFTTADGRSHFVDADQCQLVVR